MAEGVVVGVEQPPGKGHSEPARVSLTTTGRVRVKVIRRSYNSGEKPVVDVAPDRLVVLKPSPYPELMAAYLPKSDLPTQAERARDDIRIQMASYVKDLRSDHITWGLSSFTDLADFHAYANTRLKQLRRKLKALDE
jgi:hypothetical protein